MPPRAPRPVTTLLLLCAAPALAAADPAPRPRYPRGQEPPALVALRSELSGYELSEARERQAHFRPLCDDEGYPLVGNVSGKGQHTRVSQFCADVRARVRKA